ALSRHAVARLAARPELAAEVDFERAAGRAFSTAEMDDALQGFRADDEIGFKRRLRQLRERVLLRTMARDLAGDADLAEVCRAMSELAEACVRTSLEW